ncbi:ribonuclease H-like domain-containing protein [Tanacetum coccineum]
MATSTIEAEYVAAANCCGQVLWIQNQMLDYGFNFMNTKIYIDNESTICIVKNPVFHSKTKHIEIRHHFIRDAYEKKLIQVLKIYIDDNVADVLTKAFDVSRTKLSTDSTKIESMKLEAIVEERRIFKCWFHYHTTNGHQFTMSNKHQELASPEQTASELASPKQTALGKDISNPLIVDSLLKTIWLSMHHVIAMKHWLFQSKRLLIYSMAGEDEFHDDNPPPPPPPVTPTQQAPHTLSTIKLPILKKGEYDIWAMKMEHYLGHTDYPIWEVIQKGNGPVQVSTDTNGQIRVLPPKTAEEILARERERKARTTLLMSIPEDHLAKFQKMTDAKDMWEAIKSRFGGNDESKKMQKYILKQQFECFLVSNSEGLHKGYDRFQSLLSQLEIHGAGVSTEDAIQKFLRSLPASWSQVSLIMRTKPGVDTLSFDDLYNNLRVFKFDVKGSTASSSNAQNVAFVSSESTSSTNNVSTAYGVSTSSGYNSQRENSPLYTDELMYSFFANQSSGPQLDHEDLEQLDEFDLEEMDLKWQVAMISMRLKKRRLGKQEEPKALVTLDGDGVDWTSHAEDEQENFALMAYNNSGSDTKVTSCSKECVESYAKLKKLYDEQREQLGDASKEIKAYTLALAKVEAQLICHQKTQLASEEKIRFIKIDLDDKTDVLTYYKKLLAEAVKEKEELKTKLENFQSSSKGLSKLLKSQMSAKDKYRLGYEDQIHEGVLSYENEVFQSVFDSRSSDVEDSPVYDRFAKVEGMHAVPPPMTGNYMPPKSDFRIDESKFTYGPKQSKTSESAANTSDFDSCETNSSVETLESVPELVVVEPKVISQPKVWYDAPIIEEYESDSDDEYVIKTSKEQEKPSFAFKGKATGQGVNRPVWNNVQRLNHQNKFVPKAVDPQKALKNKGIIDSGCSRHMTRNKAYLVEYQDYNGGPVAFGELKQFNLFFVSQMCDKKNKVLFTDSKCLVLSPDFKLPDENKVLLRVPKQNNMSKGIKRECSNARTPQQNGVAERKNMTLIEAARTMPKLSTARPKLSTNSTKIESMKLKAMIEVRSIFKCWFHYHTRNDHQFTMSNRHQELASLEKTASGKDFSNPLMADSLPKTIWFSTHHASQ